MNVKRWSASNLGNRYVLAERHIIMTASCALLNITTACVTEKALVITASTFKHQARIGAMLRPLATAMYFEPDLAKIVPVFPPSHVSSKREGTPRPGIVRKSRFFVASQSKPSACSSTIVTKWW